MDRSNTHMTPLPGCLGCILAQLIIELLSFTHFDFPYFQISPLTSAESKSVVKSSIDKPFYKANEHLNFQILEYYYAFSR